MDGLFIPAKAKEQVHVSITVFFSNLKLLKLMVKAPTQHSDILTSSADSQDEDQCTLTAAKSEPNLHERLLKKQESLKQAQIA